MAKGRNKRKKVPSAEVSTFRPTPEREARNPTESAGMARRVTPMIDIMRRAGAINQDQHDMLNYWRDQASTAEASPVRSCCDNEVRGGAGEGPSAAITSAKLELARMEGQLRDYSPGDAKAMIDVLNAVARDDMSLSQYCVEKYGGRERYNGKGKFVAVVPVSEKRVMAAERINLLYAARVITR